MVTNPSFVGPSGTIVLHPVAFEDVEFSTIFSNRDGDLKFSMRVFEEFPSFAANSKPLAGLVEIVIDRLEGIRIFRNAVFQNFRRVPMPELN